MNSVQANVTPAAQCEQANDARNTAGCIGIFGSAFDPPHQGHRDVLAQCIDRFQHIILIASFSHAFGKQMTPYSQRLELLEAFRQSSGFANKLSISTVEQDLAQPDAPVYSWDLMEYLEGELQTWHSNVALTLIVGPDNAAPDTWSRWYRGDELRVRWPIFVARNNLPVRSTRIREAIAAGLSVNATWLTPAVQRVIEEMMLYRKPRDE